MKVKGIKWYPEIKLVADSYRKNLYYASHYALKIKRINVFRMCRVKIISG